MVNGCVGNSVNIRIHYKEYMYIVYGVSDTFEYHYCLCRYPCNSSSSAPSLSLTLSLVVPVSKNYNSDTCIDQEYI